MNLIFTEKPFFHAKEGFLSKKIERRRNAVHTKNRSFFDAEVIICNPRKKVNSHQLEKSSNKTTCKFVVTRYQFIVFEKSLFLRHAFEKKIL